MYEESKVDESEVFLVKGYVCKGYIWNEFILFIVSFFSFIVFKVEI